jgi:hypothetical protein
VRIDPDEAERLVFTPQEIRRGGNRSRGQAVIAAEHEREASLFQHFQ